MKEVDPFLEEMEEVHFANDGLVVLDHVTQDLAQTMKGNPDYQTEPTYLTDLQSDYGLFPYAEFEYLPPFREYIADINKLKQTIQKAKEEVNSETVVTLSNYYTSAIYHEGIHERKIKEEPHRYSDCKLSSFVAPLRLVSSLSPDGTDELVEYARSIAAKITSSTLINEGLALREQRKYAKKHYEKTYSIFEESLTPKNSIEKYLETGKSNGINHPPHALGDYLIQKASEKWKFDIEKIAFRFRAKTAQSIYAITTYDGKSQIPLEEPEHFAERTFLEPDHVLQIAALTDKNEIKKENRGEQINILTEKINDVVSHDIMDKETLLSRLGHGTETTMKSGYEFIENPNDEFNLMGMEGKQALDQFPYLGLLIFEKYPGIKNLRPLWKLLDSMFIVTKIDQKKMRKSLWIDKAAYDLTKQSGKLLETAIRLMQLREELFLPLIQLCMSIEHPPEIAKGETGPRRKSPSEDQLEKVLNHINSRKGRYFNFVEELNELREALLENDKNKIRCEYI